ncbi:MAG: hypothetical protein V4671_08520 [Armatimonadota bacterium]
MQKFLIKLTAITLLSIGSVGMVSVAHAQDTHSKPPLPRGHRTYQLVDKLQKAGIVISYLPDGTYSSASGDGTRYGFVVGTARLLEKLSKSEDIRHQLTPSLLNALRSLAEEFAPELKRFGFSMSEVSVLLAHRASFSNVPENHWAASSVERLRKEGILVGNQDGTF